MLLVPPKCNPQPAGDQTKLARYRSFLVERFSTTRNRVSNVIAKHNPKENEPMTFAIGRASRLVLAAAMILLVALPSKLKAQSDGASAEAAPPPANATLSNRILKKSTLQTNSTGINANCGTAGCRATKALFPTANVVCPAAVGGTCTFYVLVESSNQISDFDQGLYRFQVNGLTPTPGPTGGSGFYKFVESNPNSNATQSGSAGVVATVKNTTASQTHHVTVSFGCADDNGDGCFAFAALSSLRIDLFQP